MKTLEKKLEESDHNMVVRNLTVKEFYVFNGFLREVIPVVNLLSEKQPVDPLNIDFEKKLIKIREENSIRHKENLPMLKLKSEDISPN